MEKEVTFSVSVVQAKTCIETEEEEDESFFLGSVTSDKAAWTANIGIMNTHNQVQTRHRSGCHCCVTD